MSTIAESLGVSRCTVSLVLNGREREVRISSDTAERIRKFCRDIGYQPNIHSRRMQSSIVRNIMVCVDPLIGAPDKDNLFSDGNFSGILGGIVTAATNEDVKTTICTWHFSQPDTQELVFNSFRSREIDGLIFYGMDMPDSWSQTVIDENFHIVGIHSNPVAHSFALIELLVSKTCQICVSLLYYFPKSTPLFLKGERGAVREGNFFSRIIYLQMEDSFREIHI